MSPLEGPPVYLVRGNSDLGELRGPLADTGPTSEEAILVVGFRGLGLRGSGFKDFGLGVEGFRVLGFGGLGPGICPESWGSKKVLGFVRFRDSELILSSVRGLLG